MWRAVLACIFLAGPVSAQTAADQLRAAITALTEAEGARDQVTALTGAIRAYEAGLTDLREALRQATLREAVIAGLFDAKQAEIMQLTGALGAITAASGPELALHPDGPLATIRAGMLVADVTPALQAEAEDLRSSLRELRDIRALQIEARSTIADGLRAAQDARATLSKAISDRVPVARRVTEDPEMLRALVTNADTLDAMAAGLVPLESSDRFEAARGTLPFPVEGRLLRGFGEPDAAGISRPGLILATQPLALVTSPFSATIRYAGPLLDYGKVMILEPQGGYLLVLAGLGSVYGSVGDVIDQGAPVGMMGGAQPEAEEFMQMPQEGGGAEASETLYMELRQGKSPVDPTGWFAEGSKQTRE